MKLLISETNIDPKMVAKIRKYIFRRYSQKAGADLLNELPDELRCDVMIAINKMTLDKIPFLHHKKQSLVVAVLEALKVHN